MAGQRQVGSGLLLKRSSRRAERRLGVQDERRPRVLERLLVHQVNEPPLGHVLQAIQMGTVDSGKEVAISNRRLSRLVPLSNPSGKQARKLARDICAGDAGAVARARMQLPRCVSHVGPSGESFGSLPTKLDC